MSSIYYLIGVTGLLSALVVASSLHPVHRMAFLILVFLSGSFLMILLDFYFLGLTYIIVYVGAIMILFLFVIMIIYMNLEYLQVSRWLFSSIDSSLGFIVEVTILVPTPTYILFSIILLGAFFLFLQYNEYYYGSFTLADSVFGSVFYMTTGLHALHVIVGVLFLFVCLVRTYFDSFTTEHHIGLEFAIYYWHLVDVVWLLVFLVYYYWGA